MIRNPFKPVRRKRGFSLVEVLVALVIMSVGMLGIAGLYVQSMQAGRTSLFRHHAVTLAGDIADRIRANPSAAGAYTSAAGDEGVNHGCVAGGIDCTPAQMAQNDIDIWHDEAAELLPEGEVDVLFTAAALGTPPTYRIRIEWTEPNPAGGNDPTYEITIPVLDL